MPKKRNSTRYDDSTISPPKSGNAFRPCKDARNKGSHVDGDFERERQAEGETVRELEMCSQEIGASSLMVFFASWQPFALENLGGLGGIGKVGRDCATTRFNGVRRGGGRLRDIGGFLAVPPSLRQRTAIDLLIFLGQDWDIRDIRDLRDIWQYA